MTVKKWTKKRDARALLLFCLFNLLLFDVLVVVAVNKTQLRCQRYGSWPSMSLYVPVASSCVFICVVGRKTNTWTWSLYRETLSGVQEKMNTVNYQPRLTQKALRVSLVLGNLVPRFSLLPVERPWLGLVTCLPESGRLQTNDLGEGRISVRFVSTKRRRRDQWKLRIRPCLKGPVFL